MPANFEFIETGINTKRKLFFFSDRCFYTPTRAHLHVTYFRCSTRLCNMRGKLVGGVFSVTTGQQRHDHINDREERRYLKIYAKMKFKAITTNLDLKHIFDRATRNVSIIPLLVYYYIINALLVYYYNINALLMYYRVIILLLKPCSNSCLTVYSSI